MDNLFMHLTNYAINKFAEGYVDGDEGEEGEGHKRSLGAILQILKGEGVDVDDFMKQIKESIVKTVITAQPYLSHLYRVCQPECLDNSMCFQILGFDILIDNKHKPILLEVNASPSFGTDSSLDYKIKKNVVGDALRMLNLSYANRVKILKERAENL
jgi:tubulin polyglutamylase TTLL6/13